MGRKKMGRASSGLAAAVVRLLSSSGDGGKKPQFSQPSLVIQRVIVAGNPEDTSFISSHPIRVPAPRCFIIDFGQEPLSLPLILLLVALIVETHACDAVYLCILCHVPRLSVEL